MVPDTRGCNHAGETHLGLVSSAFSVKGYSSTRWPPDQFGTDTGALGLGALVLGVGGLEANDADRLDVSDVYEQRIKFSLEITLGFGGGEKPDVAPIAADVTLSSETKAGRGLVRSTP
jgi:hypothetical protein